MSPARYRLLAIDVDGTLLNSQDQLTPGILAALRRVADNGVQIVLATGRRYSRTVHLVEPLRLSVPLVTSGGALIKHPADHRTLFQASFEPRALKSMIELVVRQGYDPLLYCDTFAEGFDFYCPRLEVDEPFLTEFFSLNVGCGRVWPKMLQETPPGAFAGFAMGGRAEMLALAAELRRQLADAVEAVVIRSPFYTGWMCDITPAGVTKWSGIRHLADDWGIPDEAICAVGDDVNDIPMLQGAGLGIAMGNAPQEVKDCADRVAPGHNEDGLVQVVEWLLAES